MKNFKQLFSHDSRSIFFKISFFLVIFLFFIFYFSQKSGEIKIVKIAGQEIRVELARTPEAQQQGLSGRESLEDNTGMLFVFENPGIYYFWMKDMKFPIDMIWINEEQKVVHIKKNAKPESFPESFGNDENAKYVLEIPAGFSDTNNLKEGDSVIFTY